MMVPQSYCKRVYDTVHDKEASSMQATITVLFHHISREACQRKDTILKNAAVGCGTNDFYGLEDLLERFCLLI